MFGINGFHVSASGVIQGHHGPLVFLSFSEKNLQEFLYVCTVQEASIPCLLTDQNFKNNSEKGHSRNLSMRLFQNLTNSFREDFLGIRLLEPCSWTGQNFTNNF